MTLTPICIAGPTGSGKTACAMALAELLPVEIISVDSALVYRGMDIGTAKPIGSLVDHLAKRKGNTFAAPTVAVAETIAEKVLSFLRRYAQHRAGLTQQAWDTALVRHIYDVHCVYHQRADIVAIAAEAFPKLVHGNQNEFGGQFPDFAATALPVLSGALRQASADTTIQAEYTTNLIPLIYGNEAPEFAEAFDSFHAVAVSLLATLQNHKSNDGTHD